MNKPALIEKLNHAIALELCAVIQYNQYCNVLMGPDRRLWRDLFKDMSKGGLEHARKFGARVVALGGTPTIEHTAVKQASQINEMLHNAYTEALEECSDHPAYRTLLEDIIEHEQEEVDELLIYLNKVEKAAAKKPDTARHSKTG
jgi:bacterioferritin (cytochrome b1)